MASASRQKGALTARPCFDAAHYTQIPWSVRTFRVVVALACLGTTPGSGSAGTASIRSPAFEAVPDPSGPGNAAATLPRGRLSGWSALVRSESRHSLTRGPPLPRPRGLRLRHGADEGGPVSVASEFGLRSEAEPSERSDYRPTEERAGPTAGRGRLSGWSTLVRSESRQLAHSGATPPSTAQVVPTSRRGRGRAGIRSERVWLAERSGAERAQ